MTFTYFDLIWGITGVKGDKFLSEGFKTFLIMRHNEYSWKWSQNNTAIRCLLGMNVPLDPKSFFLVGCKGSENPWSRFGTKSAQNDVSTISFCIKKNASETMVFHGFAMFIPLFPPPGDWKKAPMDLLCRGSTWVQHFVVGQCVGLPLRKNRRCRHLLLVLLALSNLMLRWRVLQSLAIDKFT